MKLTIPFLCAALTGSTAAAQQSPSQSGATCSEERAQGPVGEVFFAFDSAVVPPVTPQLAPVVEWARRHPIGRVVLDGNADSTGPATYNVRLSARRAEAVRDQLIAMGLDDDHIVLALYGEDGPRRATHALDRRVTVWTTQEPLAAIVDSSLVRGTAVLWSRPVTYADLHPVASAVAAR